mmetsp:Transcript_10001/g.24622  ORF Transcript_10001/g.24622 Transcript_10001/m.24622 type:complete len:286 (+) Transcript_10001:516-1373(+)
MFPSDMAERSETWRSIPGIFFPRKKIRGVSIRILATNTPTTKKLTGRACFTRNLGLISIPIEEKNSAPKMSRTGSKRCKAFFATSGGAVLMSMPERKAPTSAAFSTFSVTIVITTHRLTTPNKRRSGEPDFWRTDNITGHRRLQNSVMVAIANSFATTAMAIPWMLPPAAITGRTARMNASAISCITRIPTVHFPPVLFMRFRSINPLTHMVVLLIAKTHPRKMEELNSIPTNVPVTYTTAIIPRICKEPPNTATRRKLTRFANENSTPSPKRRKVAPSWANVST